MCASLSIFQFFRALCFCAGFHRSREKWQSWQLSRWLEWFFSWFWRPPSKWLRLPTRIWNLVIKSVSTKRTVRERTSCCRANSHKGYSHCSGGHIFCDIWSARLHILAHIATSPRLSIFRFSACQRSCSLNNFRLFHICTYSYTRYVSYTMSKCFTIIYWTSYALPVVRSTFPIKSWRNCMFTSLLISTSTNN